MRFVHYTENRNLSLDKLYSVSQFDVDERSIDHFKPLGLWLSDDDEEDNWRDWCKSEDFRQESFGYSYLAEVDMNDLLHIKTKKDMLLFNDLYGIDNGLSGINWPSVSRKYKGIIISPYRWDMRLDDDVQWYYGWDVACACIWDKSAIKSFERIKGE